jgi:hypothetical protein
MLFFVIISYFIIVYFWLCEVIVGYFWLLKIISPYVIGYYIGAYCWLFYWWILLVILSMAYFGYSMGAYCWLFYCWVLLVGHSELTATNAPVGRSVHWMGCVFSFGVGWDSSQSISFCC